MHVTQRNRRLAENLANMGDRDSLYKALTDAGYSARNARRGWAAVPNRVIKLLAKKGVRLCDLGDIPAETQERLVRGRLVYNVIKGTDRGVASAKALGSDRRVNMFTPDTQIGVIALVAPTEISEKKEQLLGELETKPKP